MKSATQALLNYLNGGATEFYMADLFTFTLQDGTAYRYAEYDYDITYNGHVFSCSGPRFTRSSVKVAAGTQVDSMDVDVLAVPSVTAGGVPFLQMMAQGALDGADVRVERVFMETPPTPVGGYIVFSGRVAVITGGRTQMQMTVNADFELLNIQMPKNIYQYGCMHALFDAGCALSKSAWGVSGSVNAGSTAGKILCGLAQAAGYFSQGYLQFTSGANNGLIRGVKNYASGELDLIYPLPQAPAAGDTFTVYPGCDKTQATCQNKFNNVIHFRGFPYIPPPETAT
jgi:uncharacterized phage protein (TIGR02218 family)